MPPIEDDSSIKLALTQVLGALNSPHMDTRRAGLFLYGLQIAAQLTAHSNRQSPTDAVRSLCYESEGEVLAPEKVTCEPPEDCLKCKLRETCEDFGTYEDKVEELESKLDANEEDDDE